MRSIPGILLYGMVALGTLHGECGALCPLQWYDLDSLEQFAFPLDYDQRISPFQKLLILRCFRVDRVYRAVTDYVTATMGEK